MSIVQFIRLLLKHKVLLVTVPVLLAGTVFFLTRNQLKNYVTRTTMFTGIISSSSIESLENTKVDFFGVKSEFDNLINIFKSRKNLEEVGINLLAQHLILQEPDIKYISAEHYYELHNFVPKEVKNLINPDSHDKTVENLTNYMKKDDFNFVCKLINGRHRHYSVKTLSRMRPTRIGSSDIISITYDNDDPGICQQTLIILTKVFRKDYRELKEVKSDAIYKYFVDQLNIAQSNLKDSEDSLLNFMQHYNLINYYEQTKSMAQKREQLEDEYQKEKMTLAAADSALKQIEKQLELKKGITAKSSEILEQKAQLSSLSSQIAASEMLAKDSTSAKYLNELKERAAELREEIRSVVFELYTINNTQTGINLNEVLTKWLDNIVSVEESKAKLAILEQRRQDFEKRYQIFAPLGANIKRIEREIGVNEQKYLSVLHSLNQSKLKQQNIELSSEIKVVDKPYYPITPESSKRFLLVFVAGFMGLIGLIALIFLLEFLDTTIKLPARAEKLTGLPLAGTFPRLKKKNGIDIEFAANRLSELLVQQIILNTKGTGNSDIKTRNILIFSTRLSEGKTTIANNLVKKFSNYGKNILSLNYRLPGKISNEENNNIHQRYFQFDDKLFELKNIEELLQKNNISTEENIDYMFIEIPSVLHFSFPIELISSSDMSLLVCRANRGWDEADKRAIESLEKVSGHKPVMVLNGIELEHTEAILGEIPKKRSFIRKFIKKILMLQFSSGNKIRQTGEKTYLQNNKGE